MAQQEEEKKQQSPAQTSMDMVQMGMNMKGKGAVARIGVQLAARAAAALAPAAAAAAPFILIAIAIIVVVLIIVLFIIVILVAIGIIGDTSTAEALESPIEVTKTANPNFLDIGEPGQTTYTIKIKNNTGSEATNVTLTDTFSGTHAGAVTSNCGMDVGNIPAGDSVTKTCEASNINTSEDWVLSNTVNVSASVVVDSASSEGLNYYIKYGNTSIEPASLDDIRDTADNNFPDSNISRLGEVIQRSKDNGISPAFAVAIWWEEGGFGGILSGGGRANSEFGCFPGGNTNQVVSFEVAFNCFIDFTKVEHPYSSADPYGSFVEWVRYFCGPQADPICSNNPGFISRLADIYEDVAPGKIVYVFGAGPSQGTTAQTVAVTAIVCIGEAECGGDPNSPLGRCPVEGEITSRFGPGHPLGVDISSGGQATVLATISGEVITVADLGATSYGVYVEIENSQYKVLIAHFVRGSLTVIEGGSVSAGEGLGIEDSTGYSTGNHVHYEIHDSSGRINPEPFLPVELVGGALHCVVGAPTGVLP